MQDLSFSPKRSDQFVSIDGNGTFKVWDLSEYKAVFSANSGKLSQGSSCSIALDDESLITGWRDGFVRCYERGIGQPIWEIANAHRGAVTAVYVDGNYILTGGEDGAVRVWARINRKLLI